MQANKLETSALLALFENLQGTAREEFVREVMKRSTFLAEVKFMAAEIDPDEEDDEACEVTFVINVGPQKSVFQFDASNIKLSDIEPLLIGNNMFFTIDDCNGGNFISIKNGNVNFAVHHSGSLESTVPYAACAEAFQQFRDWKARSVMPAETTAVNVVNSNFQDGILSISWSSIWAPAPITKRWKLQLESLGATSVEQWEHLLAGEDVSIEFTASDILGAMQQVMNGPNAGQMVPWDNWKDHIMRLKKDGINEDELDEEDRADRAQNRSIEFIQGFYKQDGVVNSGRGYEFNLNGMKSAIQDIIAYLKAN